MTIGRYCFVNTHPINTGNVPKLSSASVPMPYYQRWLQRGVGGGGGGEVCLLQRAFLSLALLPKLLCLFFFG